MTISIVASRDNMPTAIMSAIGFFTMRLTSLSFGTGGSGVPTILGIPFRERTGYAGRRSERTSKHADWA